jgi:hypothetical protein
MGWSLGEDSEGEEERWGIEGMSFSFLIQTGTKMANCDSPEVSTFLHQALAQLVPPRTQYSRIFTGNGLSLEHGSPRTRVRKAVSLLSLSTCPTHIRG